ncbi:MAG: lanthionine synthetase LanC family protein, partial [Terriglobales bacterium]
MTINDPNPEIVQSVRRPRNWVAGMLIAAVLAGSGTAQPATFSSRERKGFREYVARTADTLVVHAEKKESGVTWLNVAKDDSFTESTDFYRGNSGTSYFLLKAYVLTHGSKYLRTAEDGLAYIKSRATKEASGLSLDPVENGLFVGNGGPGYTFLYAYEVTRNREY